MTNPFMLRKKLVTVSTHTILLLIIFQHHQSSGIEHFITCPYLEKVGMTWSFQLEWRQTNQPTNQLSIHSGSPYFKVTRAKPWPVLQTQLKLADPVKARDCSTNTSVTDWLIKKLIFFILRAIRRCHGQSVLKITLPGKKIDYVIVIKHFLNHRS